MIGDLIQSWCDMRVKFWAPSCLANMCVTSPLYIFPNLPLSLRALISCSPMHVMYVFLSENAYVSNMLYGSCVTTFNIHFGRPHIALYRAVFFMARSEYGTT